MTGKFEKYTISDEIRDARLNIAKAVTSMLERHGVPAKQHYKRMEEVVGLNYHAVRRRMLGGAPWAPKELFALGTHFGESSVCLNAAALFLGPGRAAVMDWGDERFDCTIWPGDPHTADDTEGLVAVPGKTELDDWIVVPSKALKGRQGFTLRGLIHDTLAGTKRIAVLGNMAPRLQSLVTKGRSTTFYEFSTAKELVKALKSDAFDGYVLEWSAIERSPDAVLKALRERSPHQLVIVTIDDEDAESKDLTVADANGALIYDRQSPTLIAHALRSRLKIR